MEKHSTTQSILFHLDADYQNHWVIAAHLWNDQENLYVGMIVHILTNSAGFLTGMMYIIRMA